MAAARLVARSFSIRSVRAPTAYPAVPCELGCRHLRQVARQPTVEFNNYHENVIVACSKSLPSNLTSGPNFRQVSKPITANTKIGYPIGGGMDTRQGYQGGGVCGFRAFVSQRQQFVNLKKVAASLMGLAVGATIGLAVPTAASAYEAGFPGSAQKPGFFLGLVTGAPAPAEGWYSITRFVDYSAKLVGPGAPVSASGRSTNVEAEVASEAILWSPGWKFLGGAYEAAVVEPAITTDVGSPINADRKGVHNTLFVNQLAWKLGDSGFFLKTALLTWAPTGTIVGANGLGGPGNPWWTFQPAVIFSYLKDGWNLTVNTSNEINTENTYTHYRTGDILHVDITATKSIGKWTVGPVAYYAGQITNDRSSAFYNYGINANRYNQWAVGGQIGYNFGPVRVDFWALQEVAANASGGFNPARPGVDTAQISRGFTGFFAISVPIDQQPTAAPPHYHK